MQHRLTRRGVFFCLLIYSISLTLARPIRADGPALPASLCGLVAARVICYAVDTAAPHPVTPADQRVVDFAVSPDGEWLAYRTDEGAVRAASIFGSEVADLDDQALPPAALDLTRASLAWSPDGLSIAYITVNGFRAAFSTESGAPHFADVADRLYVALRFSPGGSRLAAQDDNRSWVFFTIRSENGIRRDLQRIGALNQAGDVAWLDDNSLIVAPASGGLSRLNVVDSDSRLTEAWNLPGKLFVKLVTALDGRVFAFQASSGDLVGPTVGIAGDGTVTPLGSVSIDPRVEWAAGGKSMIYITSGTPITVDPATGAEEALPIQRISRITWASPALLTVGSISLDADVFYLAPDAQGVRQVWMLPGDGLNSVKQITHLPQNAQDFAISPDRKSLAVTTGGSLLLLAVATDSSSNFNVTATPTPRLRIVTATPASPGAASGTVIPGARVLAILDGAQPAWRPDGQQLVYSRSDGLYLVSLPQENELPQPTLLVKNPDGESYAQPRFSPDGRTVLAAITPADGSKAGQFAVISPQGSLTAISATHATWGLNALFYTQTDQKLLAQDSTGSAVLAVSSWPIIDISPFGSASNAAGQTALFLRRLGWSFGPSAIQLCATTADSSQPEIRGQPIVLADAALSPTGRFSAGLERAGDGTMNTLVILDLQNGRKMAIQNTKGVSTFQWVR